MDKQRISTKQQKEKEGKEMKPVLIVEDEAIMRESLKDWLRDEGYDVETAEEGDEALQRIGEKDFAVAVLDLRLPGKDGIEVLREAMAQSPELKGIIMTAYPSVETAVEAMKIGAVDYIVKPFTPDALEKSIEEILGPVQVEVRPEETEVAEAISISEEEILGHIAPGHMETRVWIQKTKEKLAKPRAEVPEAAVEEAVKVNECLWSKMGVVSYRICTRDYDCLSCEFDQIMQEKIAAGEVPELDEALERFKELPGPQRLCRYALKGDVSYRLCTRLFQCATCEFGQSMEDALEQKLTKLAVRREALRKKEQKAKA